MNRAAVFVAFALVAGARGQISREVRELCITFPLRDPLGIFLKPSLLQGVDVFTASVAKQIKSNAVTDGGQWEWEDEWFFQHNSIKTNSGFCFTISQDAAASTLTANEDEEIFHGVNGSLSDGNTVMAASKQGHVQGHLCCAGNVPIQTQLVMTRCTQTTPTTLKRDGPMALEQALEGESHFQASIDADGSSMMGSVKEHAHPGLMRSAKESPVSLEAEDAAEASDPGIFPAQIFVASLHDGAGSESVDLAVEQVAHLARAISGLVVVDKRLFGRLVKKLKSHSAQFRLVDDRDSGPMYVWR